VLSLFDFYEKWFFLAETRRRCEWLNLNCMNKEKPPKGVFNRAGIAARVEPEKLIFAVNPL
jgi:hypothetical protein